MRHIKKFNNLNESSVDSAEKLGQFLSERLQGFLISVKKLVEQYANDIEFKSKLERPNSYVVSTKIPLEREYITYVHNELYSNINGFDSLIEVGELNPGTRNIMLKFDIDNKLYEIPLILTMSISSMVHNRNDISYGLWLNTYVAQSV